MRSVPQPTQVGNGWSAKPSNRVAASAAVSKSTGGTGSISIDDGHRLGDQLVAVPGPQPAVLGRLDPQSTSSGGGRCSVTWTGRPRRRSPPAGPAGRPRCRRWPSPAGPLNRPGWQQLTVACCCLRTNPANAARLAIDSPRLSRQAHSRGDGRAEAQLQQGVEGRVGVVEHHPEQLVDHLGGDRGQRQPAGQVDVAGIVDGPGHREHPGVVREQPAVHRVGVLVRLAHHERLDGQALPADEQPAGGLQPALAGQVGHEGGRARLVELDLGLGQRLPDLLDGRVDGCLVGHRHSAPEPVGASAVNSAIASR